MKNRKMSNFAPRASIQKKVRGAEKKTEPQVSLRLCF